MTVRVIGWRLAVGAMAAVSAACASGGRTSTSWDDAAPEDHPVAERDEVGLPDADVIWDLGDADAAGPDETAEDADAVAREGPEAEPWEPAPTATWREIGLPFPKDFVFKGLWAASGEALFVVGAGPIAYRFDGQGFEDLVPPSPPEVLNAAWGVGPSDAWVVGMHGHALRWRKTPDAPGEWSGGPIPGAPTLFGVSGTAGDNVFAVAAGGAIFRWDGEGWSRSSVSGRRLLRGLCDDPASGLWVVGSAGTVLHQEDGVFREVPSGLTEDLSACAPGVLAVGARGTTLRADGGGVQSLGSVAYSDLTAVTSLPDGHAWAVGLDGQVVEFRPDGQVVLTAVANGKDLYAVHATSGASVWAVGEAGVAVRFNGTIWIPKDTGATSSLFGFHATGASRGLAVGAGGVALVLDAGAFAPVASGTPSDLFAAWLASADEGVVVGAGGTILRWADGSFQAVQSPTRRDLFAVTRDMAGRWWAAGDGVVLRREDDGTWRVSLSTPDEDLRAVYALDEGHVFAVGKGGAVYGFDGKNWAALRVQDLPLEDGGSAPFTASLHGVWASGPDDVWAVGESGFVLHSSGGDFEVRRADTDVTLRSVHGRGPRDVFVAGGTGTLFHFDGVSLNREATNTVATLYGVHATADGSAFAVGDVGTVLRREE